MSLKDEKIKEISEALKSADDKIVAIVYTLTMLTTEFSEAKMDLKEEAKKRDEKPASTVKKSTKANKIDEIELEDDSFDEPLVEESKKPVKKAEAKKPEPKKVVEDDFDADFDDDDGFEEVKKPSDIVKEKKEEIKKADDDFDSFDDDFDTEEEEKPAPAKKEEKKATVSDFDDDFDF